MPQIFAHDPDSDLDYQIDWAAWLATGDSIASSTWTVPAGLTAGTGAQAPTHTATTATIWLSGGTAGITYQVTDHVTTVQGRADDQSIYLRVQEH